MTDDRHRYGYLFDGAVRGGLPEEEKACEEGWRRAQPPTTAFWVSFLLMPMTATLNMQVHINKGWLSCHPGSHSQANTVNIMGRSSFLTFSSSSTLPALPQPTMIHFDRNSFISAFGSTARQDFHEKVSLSSSFSVNSKQQHKKT